MIKRLFLLLVSTFVVSLSANADVLPNYVSSINPETRGLYQVSKHIKVFKEPNEKSQVVLQCDWDYKSFNCPKTYVSNLFTVYIQAKELAFLPVVDDQEDWVQVIYDKSKNLKGWIKRDESDPYRYFTWRAFYNLYGRKYGIFYLKDAPEEVRTLHTATSEDSQTCGTLEKPIRIKLQAVRGNWLFVNALEFDKTTKIGYIKWRNITGEIYAFPAIK